MCGKYKSIETCWDFEREGLEWMAFRQVIMGPDCSIAWLWTQKGDRSPFDFVTIIFVSHLINDNASLLNEWKLFSLSLQSGNNVERLLSLIKSAACIIHVIVCPFVSSKSIGFFFFKKYSSFSFVANIKYSAVQYGNYPSFLHWPCLVLFSLFVVNKYVVRQIYYLFIALFILFIKLCFVSIFIYLFFIFLKDFLSSFQILKICILLPMGGELYYFSSQLKCLSLLIRFLKK